MTGAGAAAGGGDRLFLDANVLFSAAWREGAGLLRLWEVEDARIITSGYALAEATRNLPPGAARERLAEIVGRTEVVAEALPRALPPDVSLPPKDVPILLAALAVPATHLLTGDRRDFGHLFGKRVEGTRILLPAEYLRLRGGR